MFRIGDFSRLARVTIRTLHHYDEAGLLRPAHVDERTGYRYYTAAQLDALQRIVLLKDLGFSLDGIRNVLATSPSPQAFIGMLEARRAQLIDAISGDQARLRRLEALRDSVAGAASADVPAVALRETPAVEAHTIRARVPQLGAPVQALFEAAEAAVARARARADASPFMIFHDLEYREEGADIEVCVPVKGPGARIEWRVIPASPSMGCVTYRGPYDQAPALYNVMLHWMERSGLRIDGPLREVYHRYGADQIGYRLPAPVLADSTAEYVTELQAPVAPLA
jgi:DNA-binding transcriptional MerR regulator/effector-binding domain-containing protein